MHPLAQAGIAPVALACEAGIGQGFLGQPANTVTSLAFVLAGIAIWVARPYAPAAAGHRWRYGSLVAAVGVGSVIQHGPHPPWQAYAHDLPIAAVLAYVAVDSVRDLTGRQLSPLWWLAPTAALVPLVALGHAASTAGQAVLGTAAVGAGLLRAWRRPALRRTLLIALGLLAAGALAGNLGDRTGLCQPDSLLQGHALWHLLAAAALWRLVPALGATRPPLPAPARGGTSNQS